MWFSSANLADEKLLQWQKIGHTWFLLILSGFFGATSVTTTLLQVAHVPMPSCLAFLCFSHICGVCGMALCMLLTPLHFPGYILLFLEDSTSYLLF